jgi:hypothetical protein
MSYTEAFVEVSLSGYLISIYQDSPTFGDYHEAPAARRLLSLGTAMLVFRDEDCR